VEIKSAHLSPVTKGDEGSPGAQGMRERISQLKGTFEIQLTKKRTTVRVGVPLNKATP
jgi:signal transduction histidine kinase